MNVPALVTKYLFSVPSSLIAQWPRRFYRYQKALEIALLHFYSAAFFEAFQVATYQCEEKEMKPLKGTTLLRYNSSKKITLGYRAWLDYSVPVLHIAGSTNFFYDK